MRCLRWQKIKVQQHDYKHLAGEETSINSMALIFAWSDALRKNDNLF